MTIVERENALNLSRNDSHLDLDRQAYRNLAAWIEGELRKLTHEYRDFITPNSRRRARERGNWKG